MSFVSPTYDARILLSSSSFSICSSSLHDFDQPFPCYCDDATWRCYACIAFVTLRGTPFPIFLRNYVVRKTTRIFWQVMSTHTGSQGLQTLLTYCRMIVALTSILIPPVVLLAVAARADQVSSSRIWGPSIKRLHWNLCFGALTIMQNSGLNCSIRY